MPLKSLFVACSLLFAATPALADEVLQKGVLVVDHCITAHLANGRNNPFGADQCKSEAVPGMGKSCQVTVQSSGGVASEVTMTTPLWTRKSSVPTGGGLAGGAIERQYGKGGYSNYELSGFSGRLIRGNVILSRDNRGYEMAAKRMEVYENLDPRGAEYVRYSCTNLRAIRTAAAADAEEEATVQPASLDGKDGIENDSGSGSGTTAI